MIDVQVRGFDARGVALISPLAPDFDSRANALAPPGFAEVVQEAKPYVVIVANNAPRRIVALTLSSSNAEGQATPSPLAISYPVPPEENHLFVAPDAVGATGVDFGDRSERGIAAGGQKLFGVGFEIPETRIRFGSENAAIGWDDERIWQWGIATTRDFIARIKNQDPDTKGIRVRLDAVIFDDGLLIGDDAHNFLCREVETLVHARQELYRQIVDRLKSGSSVEEAVPSLPSSAQEMMERMQQDLTEGADSFRTSNARNEAIHTVKSLCKAYGDANIRDVLEQAILKHPFAVHRE